MYSSYSFTRKMGELFREKTADLQSFYCREDFEFALEAWRRAKSGKVFRRRELEALCSARKLDCGALIKDESLLETIPTRQDMKGHLLEAFYKLYSYSPSPAAYMERIVRRLAPEYNGDTVRTAILKKFVVGGGMNFKTYDTKAIIAWAVDHMSDEQRKQYEAASEAERLTMAVNALDDTIFESSRLKTELTHGEMLALMDRRWAGLASTIETLRRNGIFSDNCRTQLRNFCRKRGIEFADKDGVDVLAGKIAEDMARFCAEHRVPAVDCGDFIGSLRTMIDTFKEKTDDEITDEQMEYVTACFWTLMRRTTYEDKNGKEVTADQLFRTNVRDARAAKRQEEWELLRVCDNLAAGRFRSNDGETRIWLYQFAIMFAMTVALKKGDEFVPERDIVKNLFEDYYCDNMVRFLDQSFADPKFAGAQEQEPSGEGVNFKNFVEVIYIYYLYRTDLKSNRTNVVLTPGQRIDNAMETIENCVKAAKKRKKGKTGEEEPTPVPTGGKQNYTRIYKRTMVDEILSAEECELVDLIVSKYRISAQGKGRINQSSETNTAFELLYDTMADIEEYSLSAGIAPVDYGTSEEAEEQHKQDLDDIRLESQTAFQWSLAPMLREKYSQNKDFVRLVDNIHRRLTVEVESVGERRIRLLSDMLRALYIHSSEKDPLSMKALQKKLYAEEAALTGRQIKECVDTLAEFGLDVHCKFERSENRFFLGSREYRDERLAELIGRISVKYRYDEPEEEHARQELIAKLLDADGRISHKVTRTTLLATIANRYIIGIQDQEMMERQGRGKLLSLPDIYDDFVAAVGPELEDARFQPVNEKNVLDMYVILSVYLYLVEHGKEGEEVREDSLQ